MFFRQNFILIFSSVLFVLFLPGCAGESRPAKTIPRVVQGSSACLAYSLDTVSKYFKGTVKENDVHKIWDCFSNITSEFRLYVKGNTQNVYTGEELRAFIEFYFLQMYKPRPGEKHLINDDLLHEMMALKKLFLGGSAVSVTLDELSETLIFIEEMRDISLKFRPFAPLLFSSDNKEAPSPEIIFQVKNVIADVSRNFFNRLIKKNSIYEISRSQKLLHEIYNLFTWIAPQETHSDFSNLAPVLGQLKFLFLNTDSKVISSKDYIELPRLVSEIAGLHVHIKFYANKNNLFDADRFFNLKSLALSTIEFLRGGLLAREERIIPTRDFDTLIAKLEQAKLLPFGLTVREAKELSRVFFDFILRQQNLNAASGFTIEKLNLLQERVSDWASVQELILNNQEDTSNPGWREIKELATGGWGFNLDERNRAIITGHSDSTNIMGMTKLNWSREMLTFLARAYIKDVTRAKNLQLNREELNQAFLDLRPLLVGLGLVGRNDLEFDKSLFREANLFMPRSDGDDLLSVYELVEYVHFVFSGIAAGDYFVSRLDQGCLTDNGEIRHSCFREKFKNSYSEFLEHMPKYVSYISNLSLAELDSDLNWVESVSRTRSPRGGPIQKYEICRAFIFLQYIEITLLHFDKDESGVIDLDEGLESLPHFSMTVANLLKLDMDEDAEYIRSLFTYLLRYKETPSGSDPLSDLKFLHWRWHPDSWQFTVSRSSLLQILSVMNNLGK